MRFVLLVEGYTENTCIAEFLKRWLDPRLSKPVSIEVVRFNGVGAFSEKVVHRTHSYLDSAPTKTSVVGVIGLIDLYGFQDYPADVTSAAERYDWGVKHFESCVARDKFRMFFAVHEFEAWILSQPELLPRDVQDDLPKSVADPEKVDFNEPPAKLLGRLYLKHARRKYRKPREGQNLFRRLIPDAAVEKCPRLKQMLSEMLKMAKAAGL